jgi:sterol 3beta-glucosyltransferase
LNQENGTQTAIQTIYRELDRARTQIHKHAKKDNDDTDEFEEDWTIVDDLEEVDMQQPFDMQAFQAQQQPVQGMPHDASQLGRGSLALGSMVLKGANTSTQRGELSPRG